MIRKIFPALFLIAWIGAPPSAAADAPLRPLERIVLVTIDTLRADHLGCYGYPRDTSPFLDRLADQGVRFEHAFASMATTVPSHASIFTSRYPLQLGVLKNGDRLSDDATTLAEILRDLGFTTAGFVGPPRHFSSGNLAQGFDTFNEHIYARPYRQAHNTVEGAVRWVDERKPDERFFLWVNLFDPHWPPIAPEEWIDTFRSQRPTDRQRHVEFLKARHGIDPAFFASGAATSQNVRQFRTRAGRRAAPHDGGIAGMLDTMDGYDGSIRFADAQLERLHQRLADKGLHDDALWIVTSDHGEGLGSHRWLAHGKHIYNEQLRVPLIFWFSSGAHRGTTVGSLVETVDLLPTVLDLLGRSLITLAESPQGRSLRPLLAGANEPSHRRYAFAQRRVFDAVPAPDDRNRYESGEKFALQDLGHKYIHRTDGPDELYDLAADPRELTNLAGGGSEAEERLLEALREKVRRLALEAKPRNETVDAEALEALRALGYVD